MPRDLASASAHWCTDHRCGKGMPSEVKASVVPHEQLDMAMAPSGSLGRKSPSSKSNEMASPIAVVLRKKSRSDSNRRPQVEQIRGNWDDKCWTIRRTACSPVTHGCSSGTIIAMLKRNQRLILQTLKRSPDSWSNTIAPSFRPARQRQPLPGGALDRPVTPTFTTKSTAHWRPSAVSLR